MSTGSIITFHTQRTNMFFAEKIAWVEAVKPRFVKVCEPDSAFCAEVKRVSPGTLVVARDLEDSGSPFDKMNRYQARSDWSFIDILEGPNEVKPALGATGYFQAAYELELCRLAHANKKLYCALNWSEGEPAEWRNDPVQWADFLAIWGQLLREADDDGFHEYGYPRLMEPSLMVGWHTLRWPKWYDKLPADMRKPILITECNLDGEVRVGDPPHAIASGKGWMDAGPVEEIIADWIAYARRRSEVKGVFLYNWGGYDDWARFELNPIANQVRDAVLKVDWGGGQPMQIMPLMAACQFNSGFTRTIGQVRGICVHHTGSAALDANQVAYMLTKTDASYHFLIGRDGVVYQLNGLDEVVWHAADGADGPSNRGDVAVAFIGLLMDGVKPNAAQFQAFRELRQMLVGQGIGQGLTSHKQVKPAHDTDCPGDWWPLDALPPAALVGSIVVPPSSDPVPPLPDTVIQRIEKLEAWKDDVDGAIERLWEVLTAAAKALGGQ